MASSLTQPGPCTPSSIAAAKLATYLERRTVFALTGVRIEADGKVLLPEDDLGVRESAGHLATGGSEAGRRIQGHRMRRELTTVWLLGIGLAEGECPRPWWK